MSVATLSLPEIDAPAAEALTPTPAAEADPVIAAVERQGAAVVHVLRRSDPQAWLFAERARYVRTGACDPYAEQMLRRAGFLRD